MIHLNDYVTCAFAADLLMICTEDDTRVVLDAEAQGRLLAVLRERAEEDDE